MTPTDWETQLQQRLADCARPLRALPAQLAPHEVTVIEVEYDGSGDSGQVERGPLPVSVLTVSWVRVPGRDRSRRRVAPRRRSRPGRFSGWAAQPKENHVEREEDVPQLDGRAEA